MSQSEFEQSLSQPRTRVRSCPDAVLGKSTGRTQRRHLGWEDAQSAGSMHQLPNGTGVRRPVLDDTVPDGRRERVIEYAAPFAFTDRESDYCIDLDFFGRESNGLQGKGGKA